MDPNQVPSLKAQLLVASPVELPVLSAALERHRLSLMPELWTVLEEAKPGDARLLPAASALARYDPDSSHWQAAGEKVAAALVTVNPVDLGSWLDALRRVKDRLTRPLATIFEKGRPETEHILATSILADYASNDPGLLAELVMIADPKAYARLFPVAARQAEKTLPVFRDELAKTSDPVLDEPVKDRMAERQARAAVALVRLDNADDVWRRLQHSPDPRLRSFLVNWLSVLGADPTAVVAVFDRIDPSAGLRPPLDYRLWTPFSSTPGPRCGER